MNDKQQLFSDDSILGKSESHARMLAQSKGVPLRVKRKDGQELCSSCDYQPERINVEVKEGRVVAVLGRG